MGVMNLPSHAHHRLAAGWQLCALPVGAAVPSADDPAWLAVGEALTAAASLRALGRWQLQDSARRFDAQDWCWRLDFDAPAATAPGQPSRWVLGFDGMATLAEVWLNGERLLHSQNMFLAHALDVSACLRPQGNQLLIRCTALDAVLAQRRPRPRWRAPMTEQAQLRYIRTTLLGRTPGWSPAAAPVGLWRDVWLQERPLLDLQNLMLHSRLDQAVGELEVRATLVPLSGITVLQAQLVCERAGQQWLAPLALDGTCCHGALRIDGVSPWWPHTHGEPALYAAHLWLSLEGQAEPLRVDLGGIGFRAWQLDPRDEGFALRVNGEAVFCRGACWTPLDPVSLRATPEALRAAVRQVREAGMNMLRLAGSMVYEEDAFYAACDAEGVMVWQDFMFANMDYPADDEAFFASVDAEVRQQLQRWQRHACVAVLCGNSEQEQQAAMWGAERALWQAPLFHQRIPAHCAELLPQVPYWPSSAHGGDFPFRPDAGTTSYYGVGAYQRPVDDARHSGVRFATECLAFANVPPAATLARLPEGEGARPHMPGWKAGVPRDLGAGWDFDDVRDHYFERLTGERAERLRATDPARFLALSRWVSGRVMAEAFGQWRAAGSVCGGALVWFLRDLRPGAGWGLLDEQGTPKAAWHLLRQSLQPVMLGWVDRGLNGLDLQLVNERAQALDAVLSLSAWRAGSARPVVQAQRALSLPARSTQALPTLSLLDGFMDLGHAFRFGPPPCDLLLARLHDGQGRLLAQASSLPQGLSLQRLPHLGLALQLSRDEAGALWAEVGSAAPAVGLHLDAVGHAPADDYLDLAPGETRRIALTPLPGVVPPRSVRVTLAALNTEQSVTGVA